MFPARLTLVLACAWALCAAACGNNASSSSTTSPSATPADATINENFTTTLRVGGDVFYSFSMPQYGNVAVTITDISGPDVPDGVTVTVGVGRPAGTACVASSTLTASPGTTPQVTGVYGPGIFCVRIYDSGVLTSPVTVSASVAHS